MTIPKLWHVVRVDNNGDVSYSIVSTSEGRHWTRSSAIVNVHELPMCYIVETRTGSIYRLNKVAEGITALGRKLLEGHIEDYKRVGVFISELKQNEKWC